MQYTHKTWVEVSKKALQNNVRIVRGLFWGSKTQLMAVVKSNAYGHGLIETAKILTSPKCLEVQPPNIPNIRKSGAIQGPTLRDHQGRTLAKSWLGVDNVDEAILLRESGIKSPILVLGFTPANRIQEVADDKTRYTIYDSDILKEISKNWKLKIGNWKFHLKVDTGMSRQGVLVADLSEFLKNLPRGLPLEGAYTHFANADNLEDRTYPNLQLRNFHRALKILEDLNIKPSIVHASATAGLFTMPQAHFDMVRVGVALYGLWPSAEFQNKFNSPVGKLKIEPTLSWKTRIVQIKKIKKGTPVGYGITEIVKKDTKIAILPVGYYDGYMRALSGIGEVLIGGRRCKVLGRISMNLMVVDVSRCRGAEVGDEVILIGTQGRDRITAEELASRAGTISYEIASRINPLLPRLYIY